MNARLPAIAAMLMTAGCASVPPAGDFPGRLRALGTEPFWSIEIDGNRIAYSTADQPEKRVAQLTRRSSPSGLVLDGALDGRRIEIAIMRGACSDGMSDREYPYRTSVRLGAALLKGCALPRGD